MRFTAHTPQSAPDAAQATLSAIQSKLGFMPNILGAMSNAPATLNAYVQLSQLLGTTSFTPAEQQIITMATSYENGCGYCLSAHSMFAEKAAGVSPDTTKAARHGQTLPDAKLNALYQFVREMTDKKGYVSEAGYQAFLAAGYTPQQAIEVIVGCALKTVTNFFNGFNGTDIDAQFAPYNDNTAKQAA